jgi:hypothetical protein
VDIKLSRLFNVNRLRFEVFVNVFNVFDRRNSSGVYTDTGRSDYTLADPTQQGRVIAVSDIEEFYARPGMYSAPRHIQLGLKTTF